MRRFPELLGFLGLLGVSFAVPLGACAEEAARTDSEVWNEGVDHYRAGDSTNALRVLRGLMLSRTHGARAAEVVAALEQARGNREEAASAAQIALHANPDDPRANRNFTRATDGLAAAREKAHVEAVLKAAEGKDPGSLLAEAVYGVRQLRDEAGYYRTNRAERAVMLADALSERARTLSDVWYPLHKIALQSVTNQEHAAKLLAKIEQDRTLSRAVTEQLSDMDPAAYGGLCEIEGDLTQFYKGVAMPPAALAEDLSEQTNAWRGVEAVSGRDGQAEALDWTRVFRMRFPEWARDREQKAQADTNMPPFTAEQQQKILELSTELEKLQTACVGRQDKASQEKSLALLRQIQELMPKDKNQGGGGQPPPNPQQDRQPKQGPQQEQQQEPQQQQQDQPQQAERQPEETKPKEDQEVEAILQKAKERNDEHEKVKSQRLQNRRSSPDERDW